MEEKNVELVTKYEADLDRLRTKLGIAFSALTDIVDLEDEYGDANEIAQEALSKIAKVK